jgi:hypothetical protein
MREKDRAESSEAAGPTPGSVEETRFFTELFDRPERLRERLVLAIALSPPKARRRHGRGGQMRALRRSG